MRVCGWEYEYVVCVPAHMRYTLYKAWPYDTLCEVTVLSAIVFVSCFSYIFDSPFSANSVCTKLYSLTSNISCSQMNVMHCCSPEHHSVSPLVGVWSPVRASALLSTHNHHAAWNALCHSAGGMWVCSYPVRPPQHDSEYIGTPLHRGGYCFVSKLKMFVSCFSCTFDSPSQLVLAAYCFLVSHFQHAHEFCYGARLGQPP